MPDAGSTTYFHGVGVLPHVFGDDSEVISRADPMAVVLTARPRPQPLAPVATFNVMDIARAYQHGGGPALGRVGQAPPAADNRVVDDRHLRVCACGREILQGVQCAVCRQRDGERARELADALDSVAAGFAGVKKAILESPREQEHTDAAERFRLIAKEIA